MTSLHVHPQRAIATHSGIRFENHDGLSRALSEGIFALAVPGDLDLTPGITFCQQFYRARRGDPGLDPYRGFRGNPEVYFDRQDFQVEHVLTDTAARSIYFPPPLVAMVDRMTALGLAMFRAVLAEVGIPGALWNYATNGAVSGLGTHWFVAHHYRGHRDQVGCAPHKDTGFVTVLYAEQPGFEVLRDGHWTPVDPVPGHFIVNFGQSFEILTGLLPSTATATLHRVRKFASTQPETDRVSFAAFVDPPAVGDLYRVHREGSVSAAIGIEEFLRANNEKTWNDEYTDFGIVPSVSGI